MEAIQLWTMPHHIYDSSGSYCQGTLSPYPELLRYLGGHTIGWGILLA